MLDRVKESLFNIIRDMVPGSRVLDLFSGTGALGLEALSRGAEFCLFVEGDPRLVRLVTQNAERCRLVERCMTLRADVLGLTDLSPPPSARLPAGLVFVDPPYDLVDDPNRRSALFGALEGLSPSWVEPGAALVLHHEPIPYAVWPTEALREWDKRIYGRSQLTFFDYVEGEDACQ
jgi:16S rRNA (guanine966-N2)-methyltransferase